PRAQEPELAPIPFGADDTGVGHRSGDVESQRADEAPTQQIPLAAEYAALGRMTDAPADRETDPTAPRAPEERTAEIDLSGPRSNLAAPPAPPAPPAPSDGAGVPSEIEVLAQNTSIG